MAATCAAMAETLNTCTSPQTEAGASLLIWLAPVLQRLDRLLAGAIQAAEIAYGPESTNDRFRGLYITPAEIERLLRREPATPVLRSLISTIPDDGAEFPLQSGSHWERLKRDFDLSPFDLDVLMIGLAPELDLRYERLYAYLQDDVTRRHPSVDLALNLLCSTAEEKLRRREHFLAEAPLVRRKLIHLIAEPQQSQAPLLSQYFKVDDQIVSFLLGEACLDRRLVDSCRLLQLPTLADESLICVATAGKIKSLVRERWNAGRHLLLCFEGPAEETKLRTAQSLACDLPAPLLTCDLSYAPDGREFEDHLELLLREVWRTRALLCLREQEALSEGQRRCLRQKLPGLAEEYAAIVIVCSSGTESAQAPGLSGATTVAFPIPDFEQRLAIWESRLKDRNACMEEHDISNLAARFRLTSEQIANAVEHAFHQAALRAAGSGAELSAPAPAPSNLWMAARAQSGHHLAKLTRKLDPKYTWDDIVLPLDQQAQLNEICNQFRYRHVVYGDWGFDRKLSSGKGLNVLFAGPPGTGKTMAAEVIAGELGLDLYKIDLASIVSKYIGETEKNLDRVFTAAADSNAILLFDEADALFGKRSEVKDSHDRYANIEIGYLLQKMEEYEGVAILATNLRQNLDEAFVRRIQVIVEFPFPDEEHRRRIWEVMFPQEMPRGDDVDFATLSREVKLAGGNIKNIALTAAFYAAADGQVVRMAHLAQAAWREYQKIGRTWNGNGSISGILPA
jgi:hypothetical protein